MMTMRSVCSLGFILCHLGAIHAQDIACVIFDLTDVLVEKKHVYNGVEQAYQDIYSMVPEGFNLLKQIQEHACASQRTMQYCIASNCKPRQIDIMRNNADIADMFDERFDRVYSLQKRHIKKPSFDAFTLITSKYNVAPEQCVLIDDTFENVQGARQFGMHGVHFTRNDITATQNHLRQLGLIASS